MRAESSEADAHRPSFDADRIEAHSHVIQANSDLSRLKTSSVACVTFDPSISIAQSFRAGLHLQQYCAHFDSKIQGDFQTKLRQLD